MKKLLYLIVIVIIPTSLCAQEQATKHYQLTLHDVITLAIDSSLDMFIAQNNYLAEYWVYKNYKSGKLPFVNLNSTPANFNRSFSQEYNFTDSSYQYVDQQTLSSYINLSLNQNITKTGGRIYIDSDIGRLDNLKQNSPAQYTSTIIRVGLEQKLFAYNPHKWDDKILPLRYEKAKKEFLSSVEEISVKAVQVFFDLALAQENLQISQKKRANADTLYAIGKEKFKIASISLDDLYTLQLDLVNSRNEYKTAVNNLKRAKSRLNSFLRLNEHIEIELQLPDTTPNLEILPVQALKMAQANNPQYLDNRQQLYQSQSATEKAKKESRLNSTLSASFGLNQSAEGIPEAYAAPRDQEKVKLTLNIPILDWGVSRGKYELAMRQQEALKLRLEQKQSDFEQDVINTINEFLVQRDIVLGAAQADTIAQKAYLITKERFLTGKADLTKLGIAQNAQVSAKKAYIKALEQYWEYLYTIRKLTLYDFINDEDIADGFDKKLGISK